MYAIIISLFLVIIGYKLDSDIRTLLNDSIQIPIIVYSFMYNFNVINYCMWYPLLFYLFEMIEYIIKQKSVDYVIHHLICVILGIVTVYYSDNQITTDMMKIALFSYISGIPLEWMIMSEEPEKYKGWYPPLPKICLQCIFVVIFTVLRVYFIPNTIIEIWPRYDIFLHSVFISFNCLNAMWIGKIVYTAITM